MKRTDIIALGHTPELIAHIEQQIPSMMEETEKRLQFDPFWTDNSNTHCVLHPAETTDAELIIDHILARLGRSLASVLTLDFLSQPYNFSYTTYVSLIRRDADPGATLNVRGEQWPIANMPLYLDSGIHGKQFVYPMFDWSELQITVAWMMLEEENEIQNKICMSSGFF